MGAFLSPEMALYVRRGRSQDENGAGQAAQLLGGQPGVVSWGALLLLVRPLVLLIDHHESQVGLRREQCSSRADDHGVAASPHLVPHVEVLPQRQAAVHHRHLARESFPEPAHGLGRQRYLRHQYDGALAQGHCPLQRLEVHLRLTAAGDAVQQERPRLSRALHRLGDALVGVLLLGGKGGCGSLGVHAPRQWIAHHRHVLPHRQALLLQVPEDGRRQSLWPQFGQREWSLVGQRLQHHRPPQSRRPTVTPQCPGLSASLTGGGQQTQMGHHFGPHLGPRQLVSSLDETAQHQSAHQGTDAAQPQSLA
jgi:hypothetical protein